MQGDGLTYTCTEQRHIFTVGYDTRTRPMNRSSIGQDSSRLASSYSKFYSFGDL